MLDKPELYVNVEPDFTHPSSPGATCKPGVGTQLPDTLTIEATCTSLAGTQLPGSLAVEATRTPVASTPLPGSPAVEQAENAHSLQQAAGDLVLSCGETNNAPNLCQVW